MCTDYLSPGWFFSNRESELLEGVLRSEVKETSFVVAYLSSVPWCPSCEASGVGIGGSFVGTDVARQGMTSIPDPVMERDCCSPPQEGPGGDAIPPGKRREKTFERNTGWNC